MLLHIKTTRVGFEKVSVPGVSMPLRMWRSFRCSVRTFVIFGSLAPNYRPTWPKQLMFSMRRLPIDWLVRTAFALVRNGL